MTKEELHRYLDEARKHLLEALTDLTEEQMYRQVESGEWSVAEVLAHLPVTERWLRSRAEAVCQEESVDIAFLSKREQQESAVRAHEMVPPQMISDLTGARWQTLKLLESLTPADLEKSGTNKQFGTMTVSTIIGAIGYHERDHTQQIQRLRQQMEAAPIPK